MSFLTIAYFFTFNTKYGENRPVPSEEKSFENDYGQTISGTLERDQGVAMTLVILCPHVLQTCPTYS